MCDHEVTVTLKFEPQLWGIGEDLGVKAVCEIAKLTISSKSICKIAFDVVYNSKSKVLMVSEASAYIEIMHQRLGASIPEMDLMKFVPIMELVGAIRSSTNIDEVSDDDVNIYVKTCPEPIDRSMFESELVLIEKVLIELNSKFMSDYLPLLTVDDRNRIELQPTSNKSLESRLNRMTSEVCSTPPSTPPTRVCKWESLKMTHIYRNRLSNITTTHIKFYTVYDKSDTYVPTLILSQLVKLCGKSITDSDHEDLLVLSRAGLSLDDTSLDKLSELPQVKGMGSLMVFDKDTILSLLNNTIGIAFQQDSEVQSILDMALNSIEERIAESSDGLSKELSKTTQSEIAACTIMMQDGLDRLTRLID